MAVPRAQDVAGDTRTVLVADDVPALRQLVAIALGKRYRVLQAATGEEAWHLLRAEHPDVAILDIRMPGLGGLDLAQAIRASADLAGTVVVLLTARSQEADRLAAEVAGADAFLPKPFSTERLLTTVEAALRQR